MRSGDSRAREATALQALPTTGTSRRSPDAWKRDAICGEPLQRRAEVVPPLHSVRHVVPIDTAAFLRRA